MSAGRYKKGQGREKLCLSALRDGGQTPGLACFAAASAALSLFPLQGRKAMHSQCLFDRSQTVCVRRYVAI